MPLPAPACQPRLLSSLQRFPRLRAMDRPAAMIHSLVATTSILLPATSIARSANDATHIL